MTILHGDARFYNNIFVQKPIREDLVSYVAGIDCGAFNQYQFVCGTKPYDGYPKAENYFKQFTFEIATDQYGKDIYYNHLPVYTGGNVYFNGAQPCNVEENYKEIKDQEIALELKEENGNIWLKTNIYDYLPVFETPAVSTEFLGEAFEPEQKFESPDGLPIVFDRDYFGMYTAKHPLSGPFAEKEQLEQSLFQLN